LATQPTPQSRKLLTSFAYSGASVGEDFEGGARVAAVGLVQGRQESFIEHIV